MQCKDIPDRPILEFLVGLKGVWGNWFALRFENSVRHAMPKGTPDKLLLAKMRMMIRRKVVEGCCCGCRGDFVITEKGTDELLLPHQRAVVFDEAHFEVGPGTGKTL